MPFNELQKQTIAVHKEQLRFLEEQLAKLEGTATASFR